MANRESTSSGAFPGHADSEDVSDYERGRSAALAEVMAMLRDMRAREASVIAYWRARGGEDGYVSKFCDRQLTLMSLVDALKDMDKGRLLGARLEHESTPSESWVWQPAPTDTERWVICDGLYVAADVERVDESCSDEMWYARVWDRGISRNENKRARIFLAFRSVDEAKRACERVLSECRKDMRQ